MPSSRHRTLAATLALALVGGCADVADRPSAPTETVTPPALVSGPTDAVAGDPISFAVEGTQSDFAHDVEYQVDFGDRTLSPWRADTTASHAYLHAGTYAVRGRARCAVHVEQDSPWTAAVLIDVDEPVIPDTVLEGTPPDPVTTPDVTFRWSGEPQASVSGYEVQVARTDSSYYASGGSAGRVLASILPSLTNPLDSDDTDFFRWSAPRTDPFVTLQDATNGWYELRVRALGLTGAPDETPLRHAFRVLVAP
jgi:hypothetical protein